MISINNACYEVIEERNNGFDEEAFKARYSDILNKYDYIVGDWSYDQLRLKGFYEDSNSRATFETKISSFEEYLYEFCSFGCRYFVLKKTKQEAK
ncbi:MAG: YutD family protein [Bacillaceae bacterium]